MSKVYAMKALFSLSRRASTAVAAESVRAAAPPPPPPPPPAQAAGMRAAADAGGLKRKEEVFWMRDPKTGCWVPENRFQEVEVDAAELRAQHLANK